MPSEIPKHNGSKEIGTTDTPLPFSWDAWQVLIVDPDQKNPIVISNALSQFVFKNRPISLLKVNSFHEAKTLFLEKQNIAVMLLHLSRETTNEGRWLIHYIRETLKNQRLRIIIQTDVYDSVSHPQLLEDEDIHDLFLDSEINSQKMNTVFTTALSAYQHLQALDQQLRQNQVVKNNFLESEQRFKDITVSIGDLIWEMDPHGKYTYVSDNVRAITGYTMEELNEIHFSAMFIEKKDATAQKRIHQRTQACLPFKNIEIWKKHKNKKHLCFLTNGRPILDADGTLLGYCGIDRDITEYKLSEKENERLMVQLNQAQRLEALGTLAGGIAHDFNNILGVILGYAQLLQIDVSSDSKICHFTQQMIDGCNRAKNLTMQILDFSRLKEEKDQSHDPINPTSVVKEKLKMLRATIPSSITIESDIPSKTHRVLASPNQISQIITNLLTNAYQAMEGRQGTISIKMRDISLTAENFTPSRELNLPHGEYVTIEVQDNGKGISRELKNKIFNPYFTTKQGGDGRGLGLSMVHSFITRCKGAIVLDSWPGKGTHITLYLPAFPDAQKKNNPSHDAIAGGEGKILFVDDEKMLVDLGKMMLERIGYQAVAIQSPTEALAAFQKDPNAFDLVISDLTMPDLLGTQLAHEIKKIRPDIPVILATGFDIHTVLPQDNNKDIDEIVSKPLSINVLSETIKKFRLNAE